MKKAAVLFVIAAWSCSSFADTLGTLPVIEQTNLRLIFDVRSDLWTSPYRDKTSPIRIYDARMRIPMIRHQGWVGSVNLEGEGISLGRTDLVLGPDRVNLGSDFRSQSIGLGLTRDLPNQASFTFYVSHVSESDEPFQNARDRWFEGTVVYRSPSEGALRWVAMVNQTQNRGFHNGRPFPYFGVMFEPSNEFNMLVGFPFFRVNWANASEWTHAVLITPVEALAVMERDLNEKFRVHVMAAVTSRSYLHVNRSRDDDRFFYEEKKIESGFNTNLTDTTGLRFSLGYSFDRRIYEGSSIYDHRGEPLGLNRDVYGHLGLEFRLWK